ncbi:relaxase/mobilization nuclease domain-containing protein [Facklamia sp. P9177]|uniref:relaxase/mobilization nuclease domain-containing protein n=1 Tax=Facklamia sp. P9177 TaxID=3421945 RepID=UPI003D167AC5
MAILSIKPSKHGRASIKYVVSEKSHREGMDRVLEISGVNCLPETALDSFSKVWDRFNVSEGKNVQTYNVIQSFSRDEFIVDNLDDVKTVHEIGLETGRRLFPGRQVLVVTQADTKNAVLHNHIVINNPNPIDGKKLSGAENRWINLQPKHDEILREFGANVIDLSKERSIDRRTISEIKTSEQGEYVWKDDLRDRILQSISNPKITSMEKFKEDMILNHRVDVKERKNGNLSYYFIDEDFKERKIRAGKLGTRYAKEKIHLTIELNAQGQRNSGGMKSSQKKSSRIKRSSITQTPLTNVQIIENDRNKDYSDLFREEPTQTTKEVKKKVKPKKEDTQASKSANNEDFYGVKRESAKSIPMEDVEELEKERYNKALRDSQFKQSLEYKILKAQEEAKKKNQHN